jgi:hypothetical protein
MNPPDQFLNRKRELRRITRRIVNPGHSTGAAGATLRLERRAAVFLLLWTSTYGHSTQSGAIMGIVSCCALEVFPMICSPYLRGVGE